MNKKMKEQSEEKENNQVSDNNMSGEQVNGDDKTENSADENTVEDQTQNVQSENQEESEIPVDQEKVITEWKDKYLRLSAEFDNYRKRTLREKIELTKYANEELLLSILPVVDDFEHGLKTVDQASDMDAVKQGLGLIYNKFKDFLSQKGLKEIAALDVEFNTDFHEAVAKTPVQDNEKSGKIIDVVQKGYMLDDKIIRHSKVVIGE
jgi:molecular chaperone GrpE